MVKKVGEEKKQARTREEAGEGKKAWSIMGSWTPNAGPTCCSIAPIEFADLCVAIITLPHLPVTQELHPAAVRP
jgi:hypothetical protein